MIVLIAELRLIEPDRTRELLYEDLLVANSEKEAVADEHFK